MSFTSEEIKEVVWCCEGGKSPGPDDYGFNFYKSFWETIEEDVCKSMHEFF